jgi:hypothetical protein
VRLYAESSAVLVWLLDQEGAPIVRRSLAAAEDVISSDLTLIESDRALHRLVARGSLTPTASAELQARLATTVRGWNVMPIGPAVVDRARQPFPGDSIRSLDAIHLAAALVARSEIGDLVLLSVDDRLRMDAEALGFRVLPE